MKRTTRTKAKRGSARSLFAELSEGMEALADARQGKRTLRTHALEFRPAPSVTPQELIRVRKSLKISRALFAVYLRTNVHSGKLGAGSRQAKRTSGASYQSRQALPGYSSEACNDLISR